MRGMKGGKPKVRSKVSRQVQLCETCKQAMCTTCWDKWYSPLH